MIWKLQWYENCNEISQAIIWESQWEDATNDEWAVDHIESHSGTKLDTLFEVHWKLGDIIWLPYYQITHLKVLTDYLDLLGVSQISKLPNGQERPPVDDPQIHLGSIIPCPSVDSTASCLSLLSPIPFIRRLSQSVCSLFLPSPTVKLSNTTVDFDPLSTMPKIHGVNHPYFTWILSTHYLIDPPTNELTTNVHVGQIADYTVLYTAPRVLPDSARLIWTHMDSICVGLLESTGLDSDVIKISSQLRVYPKFGIENKGMG
jgi:hypothetical protein